MGLDYQKIITHFDLEGEIGKVEAFGNGLIHQTFRLHNQDASAPDYLLQRINDHVFHDITGMTANLEYVTSHLSKKYENANKAFLDPIKTGSGELIHRTSDNQYWRVFVFLKGYQSFDTSPGISYVYEGAKAFGNFIKDMSDFPVEKLKAVIPDFHHLGSRFEQLGFAKKNGDRERLNQSAELIKIAELQYKRLEEMVTAIEENLFPLRVTHNDTKFNNVLFQSNGEARCVIDLDTTMPGVVHYDLGDGLRTGAVDCDEDEKDLEKVAVNDEKLTTYCRGFIEPLKNTLAPIEIRYLPLAASYMALIMGVRFLSDFINNDSYYHIEYPDQNFRRARCQIRLGELFYEKRQLVEQSFNDL